MSHFFFFFIIVIYLSTVSSKPYINTPLTHILSILNVSQQRTVQYLGKKMKKIAYNLKKIVQGS